ncbi:MAG: hypothetical protein H6842_15490 [Rhodospirillaceae bacterium]|nr:hypothetical protein [Rhodospirillaceae bacterium]
MRMATRAAALALAATIVAGCLPYPVSRVADLQESALVSSLPLVGRPAGAPVARVAPTVIFADPGYGWGGIVVVMPDGRQFQGDFTMIDRGWQDTDWPEPGPGRLEATLHEGTDTMRCQIVVGNRTALAQSGVGTCGISDGGTTSVMW